MIAESCTFGGSRSVGEYGNLSRARKHLESYPGLIHRVESDRQVTIGVSAEHISGHSCADRRSAVLIQVVEVVDRVVMSVHVNSHGFVRCSARS
jgi:hypothetical protein